MTRSILLLALFTACRPAAIGPRDKEDSWQTLPDDTGDTTAVPADPIYDLDHLLEVEITLAADDWAALRVQERNIFDVLAGEGCLEEPFGSPYTWFDAEISLDGELVPEVTVRKKGLVGSVTDDRPSLKVDFNRRVDDQTWRGAKALTFNNQRQDPSRVKACLGYEFFARAEIPASKCNLAHLVVNGEDLGVYDNVEPVKEEMIEDLFGSSEGSLYEGTLSDFRDGWTATFDDKFENGDPADLQAVVDALDAPDDELEAALSAVVDLEDFTRFWAGEVLVGHWDSYSGNTNNFFIYKDPADGRFRFLPWGIDAILEGESPFGEGAPVSVVAGASIPNRLYATDWGRKAYFEALDALLEDAWDEDLMLDQLSATAQLAEPALGEYDDRGAFDDTVTAIRRFIKGRRDAIEEERSGGDPAVNTALRELPCLEDVGGITVSFETTWNSYGVLPTFTTGSGEWSFEYMGNDIPMEFLGAVAGEYETNHSIIFVSGQLLDGTNLGFYALVDTDDLDQPGTLPVDWSTVTAYLLSDPDGDYQDFAVAAYLGEGELVLEEASTVTGAPLSGVATVRVYGG